MKCCVIDTTAGKLVEVYQILYDVVRVTNLHVFKEVMYLCLHKSYDVMKQLFGNHGGLGS